ncbi:isochorismate synthase [Aldersonia sp. NBC_00410]|uniref:isochorismate synthase n=1 Tax=Aldersonia sp. NBC_00410 TaxID=2975954 RepID=UPI0022576FCD|nr:isochorismate synthase [Aldersonia sp. NBC_00410]MCX5043051.1 isochorismate synthase [Aldersonia sp. NBC_00410]
MDGFLFARAGTLLRTSGTRTRFTDADTAATAIRSGAVPLLVGALPFDPARPAAFTVPQTWTRGPGPVLADPLPALPAARVAHETPSRAEHIARVRKLLELLEADDLRKVVAARSVQLVADAPIDPALLLAHLLATHPTANGFAVNLPATTLVGASPELLVARRGASVSLRPMAGTAPRHANPATDRATAEELLGSAKNLAEHAFVIEWIRERLAPLCTELDIPATPELVGTPEVWHLATPVHGVLRDPATTALDLAIRLHPTPAVCGTPTDAALATILELEEERGFYGGTVGWCDERGDGEWIVAIRCAELAGDGRSATAWAGGGIVIGSDPQAELDETTSKLRTLLGALGAAALVIP